MEEAVQFFHISRLLLNLGNSKWQLVQMSFSLCSSAVLLLWNPMFQFPELRSLMLVLLTEGIYLYVKNNIMLKIKVTKVELIEYRWSLWVLPLCGRRNSGQRAIFQQCLIFLYGKTGGWAGLDWVQLKFIVLYSSVIISSRILNFKLTFLRDWKIFKWEEID